MAISVLESEEKVVFDSIDVLVTLNGKGDVLTFFELVDTRAVLPPTSENVERMLGQEVALTEKTAIVLDPTGYCKIYRPYISVNPLRHVDATINSILKDMEAAT